MKITFYIIFFCAKIFFDKLYMETDTRKDSQDNNKKKIVNAYVFSMCMYA